MIDLSRTAPVDVPLALWHVHHDTAVGDGIDACLPGAVDRDAVLEGAG